jgi:hypothetical protein
MGNVPLPPNQQVLSDAYYAGAMADVYFYFFFMDQNERRALNNDSST